jgi:hypothetical protein
MFAPPEPTLKFVIAFPAAALLVPMRVSVEETISWKVFIRRGHYRFSFVILFKPHTRFSREEVTPSARALNETLKRISREPRRALTLIAFGLDAWSHRGS